MNATPPPGWYPDYTGTGQRYWDGQRWTEHTAPATGQTASVGHSHLGLAKFSAGTSPLQSNWFLRHKVLTGALAIVVLIFVAGVLGSTAEDPTPVADSSTGAVDNSDTEAATETVPESEPEPEPVDTDGDGAADEEDFRPDDPEIQTRDDLDTDRDGLRDGDDLRPRDPKVQTRDDLDTDRDGVADYRDDFPRNAAYSQDADDDRVPDQLDAFPHDAKYSKDADGDRVADAKDAFPHDQSRSKITLAMENALASAENYLDFKAFSRMGLIDQLSSEYGSDFNRADAVWAVDQLGADWKQQAVLAAKEYLEFTSFSRQGLIEQLSSKYGSQFTVEEATYAVNKIGL